MKKSILTALMMVGVVPLCVAEDYDRVAASFDCSFLSPNRECSTILNSSETLHMVGGAFNYVHGFRLGEVTFLEAGVSMGALTGNSEELTLDNGTTLKEKFSNVNLQVPLNLVYRFPLSEKISLSAFAGLVGKYNLSYKVKTTGSGPDGHLSHTIDLLSDTSRGMNKNTVWHRLQAAWQIGLGLNIKKYYVGISGGTDIIPVYSRSKATINSASLKVTLGYTFRIGSKKSSPQPSHPKSMAAPKSLTQ